MSMLYDDFAPNETTKNKDCPCCKCDAHWSACRFVIIMTQKLKEIMKDTINSRRIRLYEIKSKM